MPKRRQICSVLENIVKFRTCLVRIYILLLYLALAIFLPIQGGQKHNVKYFYWQPLFLKDWNTLKCYLAAGIEHFIPLYQHCDEVPLAIFDIIWQISFACLNHNIHSIAIIGPRRKLHRAILFIERKPCYIYFAWASENGTGQPSNISIGRHNNIGAEDSIVVLRISTVKWERKKLLQECLGNSFL